MSTSKAGHSPQSSNEPIRVLIADDHPIVRSGLRNEILKHSDMMVVGEAVDGSSALRLVQMYKPTVLILDIRLPDISGIKVINHLKQLARRATGAPLPHVLALSAYCDREYITSMIAAGAKGYLLKDEDPSEIVQGVRHVISGQPAFSGNVLAELLAPTAKPAQKVGLTHRQLSVLKLMARGYTNTQIAESLVIAEGTVKNYATNIYDKLPDVNSRAEAVAWAWENGIVTKTVDSHI